MDRKRFDNRRCMAFTLIVVVIAVIALSHFAATLGLYLMGDDYGHCRNMRVVDSLHRFYLHTGRFFLSTNGRFFDNFCGAMLAYIPRGILSVICAAMVALLYAATVRAVHFRRSDMLGPMLLIAVMTLTLPWGDRTMMFAVQFNYIWPSALTLFVIDTALRRNSQRFATVIAAVLAFPAGMGHEVCGPAVVCGLVVYQLCTHRLGRLDNISKLILGLFTFGAVFCCLSPAPLARIGRVTVPDDPYLILILKSDFYVILLIIAVVLVLLSGRRLVVRGLFSTSWSIWAVAAVASMLVSPLGGVVGRSGWFAQIFALIALFIWLWRYAVKFRGEWIVAAVTALLLMCYFAGFAVWQVRLNRQINDVMTAFFRAPDEPVVYDYVSDAELPVWLLKRVMTVPDPDGMSYSFSERIADSCLTGIPMILPVAVAKSDFSQLCDTERRFGDCIVTSKLSVGDTVVRDGHVYHSIHFRKDSLDLWLLRPKIDRWGQRPPGGR